MCFLLICFSYEPLKRALDYHKTDKSETESEFYESECEEKLNFFQD